MVVLHLIAWMKSFLKIVNILPDPIDIPSHEKIEAYPF